MHHGACRSRGWAARERERGDAELQGQHIFVALSVCA